MAFAAFACKKDPQPTEKPEEPEVILPDTWTAFKTTASYYGFSVDGKDAGYKYWQIVLNDKTRVDQGFSGGEAIICNIVVGADQTFESGLPVGEWTLNSTGALAPGVLKTAWYAVFDKNEKTPLTSGKLRIKKEGTTYNLYVELLDENKKSFASSLNCTVGTNMDLTDVSHKSTMTADKEQTTTAAVMFCMGGEQDWTTNIYLTPAGYSVDPNTARREIKQGSMIQLQIYTPVVSLPEGKYPFSKSQDTNTACAGFYNSLLGATGSYWAGFDEGGSENEKDFAGICNGDVTITKQSDGNYTITLNGYDDNLEQPHAIKTTYSGVVSLVDDTKSGDFAKLVGTYNGGEELSSWDVDLQDDEYVTSEGAKGTHLTMNIAGKPTYIFKQGIPEGTFEIKSSVDGESATDVKFIVNGKSSKVSEGTVTIKYGLRSRYYVAIEGKMNDAPFSKMYHGQIETVNNDTSHAMDQKDEELSCYLMETVNYGLENGLQHWRMWYYDQKYVDTECMTGVDLAFDVYAPADQVFVSQTDMPVGTFKVLKAPAAGEVGIYMGDYSIYNINFNYDRKTYSITGGSMVVTKDDSGYNIKLDLESNGFKLKADGKPVKIYSSKR